uniref:TLC domain-containing protein n=1 Tax=Macrostomum lignano TaxID=282301 RepID=A0A1I8FJ45_9PLAT
LDGADSGLPLVYHRCYSKPGRIRTGDLLINGFISSDRKFANRFANFLIAYRLHNWLCYMTQKHCGAAGIAFLLITQMLKPPSPICQLLCSILTCLCGPPSLFVWAKALQSGQASLPVADPHYSLSIAFALIYALDSMLGASETGRFYAPPMRLSWPMAVCLSVLLALPLLNCTATMLD